MTETIQYGTAYDANGTELHVSDRVALVRDYSPAWKVGAEATIITIRPSDIGVEYDIKSGGHSLGGLLPRELGGQWHPGKDFIKVEVIPEDKLPEEALKQLADKDQFVMIGGKYYQMQLVPAETATNMHQTFLKSAASRIVEERKRATVQIQAERERSQTIIAMPEITRAHLAAHLRVFKRDANCITYVLPLRYAPRWLCKDFNPPHLEISPEDQATLAHDIWFALDVVKTGQAIRGCLYADELLTHEFPHYHGGYEECFGTAPKPVIKAVQDVFNFRDRYQKELESINSEHGTNSEPADLPRKGDLKLRAKRVTAGVEGIWSVAPNLIDIMAVGGKVKILSSDLLPAEINGQIGKVVKVRTDDIVFVEFLFEFPGFEDGEHTGKPHRCYGFRKDRLQRMPQETRRTRLATPTTSTTPTTTQPATAWTTDPAPTPRTEGTFFVGDRVKLRLLPDREAPTYGWATDNHEAHFTTVGTVTRFDPRYYIVDFPGIYNHFQAAPQELYLAEEEEE